MEMAGTIRLTTTGQRTKKAGTMGQLGTMENKGARNNGANLGQIGRERERNKNNTSGIDTGARGDAVGEGSSRVGFTERTRLRVSPWEKNPIEQPCGEEASRRPKLTAPIEQTDPGNTFHVSEHSRGSHDDNYIVVIITISGGSPTISHQDKYTAG